MNLKYSIIIAAKNCNDYVKDCILSVLQQSYESYELIVSDNHSALPLEEYINSLHHPAIRLIKPPKPLAMVEHFEFALTHARGDWIVTLGADDGVQPYFFALCNFLTEEALKRDIFVINGPRAYFFWDGCEATYGSTQLNYEGRNCFCIKNARFQMLNALIGAKRYIDLPQMYTTSLVHKRVIEKVKKRQNGLFYTSINPDASGAATICSLEQKYLESKVPFTWVGTSPKSVGYQFGTCHNDVETKENLVSSTVSWNSKMGDFDAKCDKIVVLEDFRAYLYESILQSKNVQGLIFKHFYGSRLFKTIFFSNLLIDIKKTNNTQTLSIFKNIVEKNLIIYKNINRQWMFVAKCIRVFFELFERFEQLSLWHCLKLNYTLEKTCPAGMRLLEANEMIAKTIAQKNFFEQSSPQIVFVPFYKKSIFFFRNCLKWQLKFFLMQK